MICNNCSAALLGALLSTLATCIILVITARWHGSFSSDSLEGVQKTHAVPTPRVGSLGLGVGLITAAILLPNSAGRHLLINLLIAGFPALAAGLMEDLTKKVSVLQRLLATILSGLVAWWLTDHSLTRLDLPMIDPLLQIPFVSVVFTAFAVAGVANSLNIVDGFNGLAALTSLWAFIGIGVMGGAVGDQDVAIVAAVFAFSSLGFLLVNWPWGKLFLGDGGAYLLGFALAWLSIILVSRNGGVSAFALLLICAHPVNEVVFTIYRRMVRRVHPGMPDRLHLHSLFNRRAVRKILTKSSSNIQNSVTGVMVSLLTLVSVVLAVNFYSSTKWSIASYLVISLIHYLIYLRLIKSNR